jgi:cardiolipin synthase
MNPALARTAGTAAAAALALSACAPLPRAQAPVSPVPQAALPQSVTVRDHKGPLSEAGQAQELSRMASANKGHLTAHHVGVLAAQGEVDLYRGNAARLLVDGPATFGAMKAAIQGARTRVLLESYIVEDSGVAAEIGALLAAKAAKGVIVALLYDALGSRGTDPDFFAGLRTAGVAVCAFNPLNPVRRVGYWDINHRNHRKVVVVDNKVAFTGGINISQVYASGSSRLRKRSAEASPPEQGWRDTQIELKGPVVEALAQTFERNWQSQGCHGALAAPAQARTAAAAPPAISGDRIVKVLASDPRDAGANRIYDALLAAIRASVRSVHLTMAYFAPGPEMVQALCDAARRGVDVVLVLPGRSDFQLVLHAGRSYYRQLLDAGVRIHEMEHAIMHSKTAVIDGVLSTVGSSNMDWRSFVDNSELNVIVLGEDFGAEMEAMFNRDRAVSPPIDVRAWNERGLRQRFMEQLGRAAERWL